MNAHSTIVPDAAAGAMEPLEKEAHCFRSRFIGKFAQIEAWAYARLQAADPKTKVPPTLGLKLGAVAKLTETHPRLFRKAAAAARLLSDLKPYHEMRSTLAHSTLTTMSSDDGQVWIVFDQAVGDATLPWRSRLTLSRSELGAVIGRVNSLANELRQQSPAPV
jgi:hypothetical protein